MTFDYFIFNHVRLSGEHASYMSSHNAFSWGYFNDTSMRWQNEL